MRAQPKIAITDYHVIRTLGSGATGKVKLARHPHTDQLVALKIVRKSLLLRERTLFQKVRREIALMKLIEAHCEQLHHPTLIHRRTSHQTDESHIGLMRLLDVYDTDSSFVLVLEYCEGGELFDLLVEEGYLPEENVLDLFQQLVYALDFCHARGICHRDLKPENVLLTADGRIRLADFGMASLLTPGALLDTSCGSPHYCAPEVITGESYEGCAADVWSLGVVLYAMTTGGLPFDDDNLHRLMNKIQSGAFYMPDQVPEDLADVIRSMLTVDAKDRVTLQEVKQTKWFNSRKPRPDIYKDEGRRRMRREMSLIQDIPIVEPDADIVNYLKDLGMGEVSRIRAKLIGKRRCAEREVYNQLYLSGDKLSFEESEDLPCSPKKSSNVKAVHTEMTAKGMEGDLMLNRQVGQHNSKLGREKARSNSWFEQLATAIRNMAAPTVVKIQQVDATYLKFNMLRSVTSV